MCASFLIILTCVFFLFSYWYKICCKTIFCFVITFSVFIASHVKCVIVMDRFQFMKNTFDSSKFNFDMTKIMAKWDISAPVHSSIEIVAMDRDMYNRLCLCILKIT